MSELSPEEEFIGKVVCCECLNDFARKNPEQLASAKALTGEEVCDICGKLKPCGLVDTIDIDLNRLADLETTRGERTHETKERRFEKALQEALEELTSPVMHYDGIALKHRQYAGMVDKARTIIENALGIERKGGE